MFNKEQVQKAIKEIDGILSNAKIIDPVLTRQDHFILINNVQLIQAVCMTYFDDKEAMKAVPEKKDVGTDKPIECPTTCNQNCKRSG